MKTVNGLPVYEGTDTAALDEYSEKMAEEIPKIIRENSYDDTAIKKEIQELDDNQIHITTEKSDNLNVKDASGQNAKINAFGISKQETRSGKNKFNIDNLINVTEQNVQTGSFVASSLYGTTIINNINLVNLLKPNTNYKCIANVTLLEKPATITSNIANMLTLYKSIAPANNIPVLKCSNTTEKNNWQVNETKQLETTFTTDNDLSLYNMLCYCYANDTEVAGKFKFENIMILEATEQDKTFEQYGASPSPEYPSEIQNTTGNVNITDCNKNLLDLDKCTFYNCIKNDDLSVKSSIQNSYYCSIATTELNNFLLKNLGKSVTFSLEGVSDKNISILVNGTRTDSELNFLEVNNSAANSITLQIPETFTEITNLQFRFNRSATAFTDTTTIMKNFQLELKETRTDYIENEQQLITFPLAENQKMMEGSETKDDGIHHKRKQIELDGTENWQVINENVFYLTLNDIKISSSALMTHFKYTSKILTNLLDNEFTTRAGTGNSVWIKKEGMTLEELKTYLAQQKANDTPVVLEYEPTEEEVEAYTEKQQTAYNQLQNAKTYKTITNVFTENAELEMEYIADTKIYVDNEINSIKNQLNTINELLSTTNTSALLLNNLQTDLESEVL